MVAATNCKSPSVCWSRKTCTVAALKAQKLIQSFICNKSKRLRDGVGLFRALSKSHLHIWDGHIIIEKNTGILEERMSPSGMHFFNETMQNRDKETILTLYCCTT